MEPLDEWSVLRSYVRLYQRLGFQPYRLETATINPFVAQTVLQFFGVVVNFYLIFSRWRCILYHCESTGIAVDFIKLLTILLANVVLFVELLRTIGHVCRFWRMLRKIHRTLQNQGMVDQRRLGSIHRWYWRLMMGTLFYVVAIEVYSYQQAEEEQTKRFYVYFFTLQLLLHIKEQHLMYPTILLDFYLRMAYGALEHHIELLQYSDRLGSVRYLEFLARKLNSLKMTYSDLYRASSEIREAFGWTYLIIYCKNYIQIISNSYWAVYWILNDQPSHAMRIFSRLLIRTIILFVMFSINGKVKETADRFRYRLNTINLGYQIRSGPLFVMVESFIQQTQQEQITLTAGDCFVLNCKPIITIMFTVCAYISIFIQQALKADCFAQQGAQC